VDNTVASLPVSAPLCNDEAGVVGKKKPFPHTGKSFAETHTPTPPLALPLKSFYSDGNAFTKNDSLATIVVHAKLIL
jgi:hypothetical protein